MQFRWSGPVKLRWAYLFGVLVIVAVAAFHFGIFDQAKDRPITAGDKVAGDKAIGALTPPPGFRKQPTCSVTGALCFLSEANLTPPDADTAKRVIREFGIAMKTNVTNCTTLTFPPSSKRLPYVDCTAFGSVGRVEFAVTLSPGIQEHPKRIGGVSVFLDPVRIAN